MDKKEIYEREMRKFSRTLKDILDMNREKPFELMLYRPDCKAITDWFDSFDINTVPEKVRDEMYCSYDEAYMIAFPYYDDIETYLKESCDFSDDENYQVSPVKKVLENITAAVSYIKKEQLFTTFNNKIWSIGLANIPDFWVAPVCGYAPETGHNMDIIDQLMEDDGYVCVMKKEIRDREGRSWFKFLYNPDPKFAKNIRDVISVNKLVHFSQDFNAENIVKHGLIPSYGDRTFTYPDERVFFYIWNEPAVRPGRRFRRMMHTVSEEIKKNFPEFSRKFCMFRLKRGVLPDDVKVYYDPNAPDCVYLNIQIKPEWLVQSDKYIKF